MKKLTIQDVVNKFNNTTYPFNVEPDFNKDLKEAGLVVVFGHSDDLIEFEGAIYEEFEADNNSVFLISPDGVLGDRDNIDTDEAMEKWLQNKKISKKIKSFFGKDNITWQYQTDLIHSTFDIIEDEEIFCRALVFDINQF